MKGSMRQPQLGMTFIGLLCILGLVGVIAYAGIRLVPVYLNYMKVAKALQATASEFKGENSELGGIRRALDKQWSIDDITVIDAKDVEVTKDDKKETIARQFDMQMKMLQGA